MHDLLQRVLDQAWEEKQNPNAAIHPGQTPAPKYNKLQITDFATGISELNDLPDSEEKTYKVGLAYLYLIAEYLFKISNDYATHFSNTFHQAPATLYSLLCDANMLAPLIDVKNEEHVSLAMHLALLTVIDVDTTQRKQVLQEVKSHITNLPTESAKVFAQLFNCASYLLIRKIPISSFDEESETELIHLLFELAIKTGEPLPFLSHCLGYYPLADRSYLPHSVRIPLRECLNASQTKKVNDGDDFPGYSPKGEISNSNQAMKCILDKLAIQPSSEQCSFLQQLIKDKSWKKFSEASPLKKCDPLPLPSELWSRANQGASQCYASYLTQMMRGNEVNFQACDISGDNFLASNLIIVAIEQNLSESTIMALITATKAQSPQRYTLSCLLSKIKQYCAMTTLTPTKQKELKHYVTYFLHSLAHFAHISQEEGASMLIMLFTDAINKISEAAEQAPLYLLARQVLHQLISQDKLSATALLKTVNEYKLTNAQSLMQPTTPLPNELRDLWLLCLNKLPLESSVSLPAPDEGKILIEAFLQMPNNDDAINATAKLIINIAAALLPASKKSVFSNIFGFFVNSPQTKPRSLQDYLPTLQLAQCSTLKTKILDLRGDDQQFINIINKALDAKTIQARATQPSVQPLAPGSRGASVL